MNVDAELEGWREDWQSGTAVHLNLDRGATRQSMDRSILAMSTAAFLDASIRRCRSWLLAVMLGAAVSAWLGLSWPVMFVIAGVFVWYGWRLRCEMAYFADVRAQLATNILPGTLRSRRARRRRVRSV
jgi:hypothetical protein